MKLSKIKENALIVGDTKCLYYNSNDNCIIFCGERIPAEINLTLLKNGEEVVLNYIGSDSFDDFDDIEKNI